MIDPLAAELIRHASGTDLALVRADGSVVSRDRLIEQYWGGRLLGDDCNHDPSTAMAIPMTSS